LSPFITRTLAFQSCITVSPTIKSKRNEKYKDKEEEEELN